MEPTTFYIFKMTYNLLFDSDFEFKLVKNRINLSYDRFLTEYNIVECQYNRCLIYVCFDMENCLDKEIYENMINFINENNLNKKYNYMKKVDVLIITNIIGCFHQMLYLQ